MRQIRLGVFETNSSSTHSIQIASSDKVADIIRNKILDALDCSSGCSSPSEYNQTDEMIEDGKLTLTGFYVESGEERRFVVHVIENALYKIQYLFGLMCQYIEDTYYMIEDPVHVSPYNPKGWVRDPKTTNEVFYIEHTKEYAFFEKHVLKYLKDKMPYMCVEKLEITRDAGQLNKVFGCDGDSRRHDGVTPTMFSSEEEFVDMFGKIMEDGHCIMLFDVPNDFNGRPDILIY